MDNTLKAMDEVRAVNLAFPQSEHIKRWKDEGKKVIGFVCSYVPEEIITAAGALPVRIVGNSKELELSDSNSYLSTSSCSFARTILQLALDNELDYLDGIVFALTCDATRRLHDVWEKYVSIPIIHNLVVPQKQTKWGEDLFRNDVLALKQKLEAFLGTTISDNALQQSADVYNKGRKLVGKLHELRKSDAPPISGTEMMEVLNASNRMPRSEFNALVEKLLAELEISGRKLTCDARLMLEGSICNTSDYLKCIEDLGGLVVVDTICSGIQHWTGFVETDKGSSVMDNICSCYLNKFPCLMQTPMNRRMDQIIALAKEYRVDGVISQKIQYCIFQAFSAPPLRDVIWEAGIPVLELDKEYGTPGTGQVATRVQAFLEMLESAKLKAGKGGKRTKPEKFHMSRLDEVIAMLEMRWEHRKAVPTTKSQELYYELVTKDLTNVKKAVEEGKPIVLYGPIGPLEILHALDIVPLNTALIAHAAIFPFPDREERRDQTSIKYGVPVAACTGQHMFVSAALLGYFPQPVAYLGHNVPCDSNIKVGEVLAHLLGCPSYILDVPNNRFGEAEMKYVVHQLEDLVEFLEKITGRKLNEEKLNQAIKNTQQMTELRTEISELRKGASTMILRSLRDAESIPAFFNGSNEGVHWTKVFRDEIAEEIEKSRGLPQDKKHRLVLYSPLPPWCHRGITKCMEDHGATIVADDCSYNEYIKAQSDNPLEAVAVNMLNTPGVYPFQGPAEIGAQEMIRGAKEYGADAALSFSNITCVQSCTTNRIIKDSLNKEGIPFHTIDVNYYDPTVVTSEEIMDKLESLFEVLEKQN